MAREADDAGCGVAGPIVILRPERSSFPSLLFPFALSSSKRSELLLLSTATTWELEHFDKLNANGSGMKKEEVIVDCTNMRH
jgi:hypothetical protein